MKLLWKLLRKHVSIGQLTGFAVADLVGVFIVLFSIQLYVDISGLFDAGDSLFGNQYLVVSKRFTTTNSILGRKDRSFFSDDEINEIQQQGFARSVGRFTVSKYQVGCYVSIDGAPSMGTDMFFESVPEEFVDIDPEVWHWSEENLEGEVPIVLPRSYLAIYNFGFAQTRSLPKLDERTISKIGLRIVMRGNGKREQIKGRVVGFSDRLNTILVPQEFMEWSNNRYAPDERGKPSRLIVETQNAADATIAAFMTSHDYEIESNGLENSKMVYLLRLVAGTVMLVGLLIMALSLYILVLSIYLLVEKNAQKMQNLRLIGYSSRQVAMPYILLALGINTLLMSVAWMLLIIARPSYMGVIWRVFPDLHQQPVSMALGVALGIWLVLGVLNSCIIYNKVNSSSK